MSLLISGDLRLAKTWDLSGFDADAAAYIQRVEWADTTPLEAATRIAINSFVVGCKADGIWSAIKASCILAGARTRLGALTPLAGTAPTSFNFVDGDYNRKTGLVGDGSTKYLSTNRAGNADPQDNRHIAVYSTTAISNNGAVLNAGGIGSGATSIEWFTTSLGFRNCSTATGATVSPTGFVGTSRTTSGSYIARHSNTNLTIFTASTTPAVGGYNVFTWSNNSPTTYSNARLAFYSIGESLDLALLDARITTLINAFAAAIP